jgi:uncharacterized protein involved in response to NO
VEGAHRPPRLTRAAARVPAHALFFPAAALYAAAVVPLSVAAMLHVGPAIPGLAFPAGHAHELLFGFALAAVAGNQLGPTRPPVLALLVALWLAARASFLALPGHAIGAIANGAFAAVLAWLVVPRIWGRAKKLRNRALPATVAALCGAAVLGNSLAAILLLSLLMLFMGGRIIAPAAAGQAYRQGGNLQARVQPRLEGLSIGVMLAALAALALNAPVVAAACVGTAGALAFVRLMRWKLWTLRGRPDLVALAAGYAWLALGLVAIGAALLAQARIVTALHLVTVGAIGTLTVNVMALTWLRLARRDTARARLPLWSTAFIALATIARVAADAAGEPALLGVAAGAWSAAYVLLLVLFASARSTDRPRGIPGA